MFTFTTEFAWRSFFWTLHQHRTAVPIERFHYQMYSKPISKIFDFGWIREKSIGIDFNEIAFEKYQAISRTHHSVKSLGVGGDERPRDGKRAEGETELRELRLLWLVRCRNDDTRFYVLVGCACAPAADDAGRLVRVVAGAWRKHLAFWVEMTRHTQPPRKTLGPVCLRLGRILQSLLCCFCNSIRVRRWQDVSASLPTLRDLSVASWTTPTREYLARTF